MAILEAGPRMLSLAENPDVLRRLFPRKEIRERAENIAATIKRAKEVEVISSGGQICEWRLQDLYCHNTDILTRAEDGIRVLQRYRWSIPMCLQDLLQEC